MFPEGLGCTGLNSPGKEICNVPQTVSERSVTKSWMNVYRRAMVCRVNQSRKNGPRKARVPRVKLSQMNVPGRARVCAGLNCPG